MVKVCDSTIRIEDEISPKIARNKAIFVHLQGVLRYPLAIVVRVSNRDGRTSSLQDLENGMTIPVAEATGYTIIPLQGLGAWRARRIFFRAPDKSFNSRKIYAQRY